MAVMGRTVDLAEIVRCTLLWRLRVYRREGRGSSSCAGESGSPWWSGKQRKPVQPPKARTDLLDSALTLFDRDCGMLFHDTATPLNLEGMQEVLVFRK